MACASSSERNRRVGTTLANASLLPELQTPPTSKSRFQHWPRHGSSCLLFAGIGEPAKRSFSHRILLPTKAKSSVCSRSPAVQQQVGCLQRLFETLPRLHASATSSHWRRRIGFAN